jgi:hypothetical protein
MNFLVMKRPLPFEALAAVLVEAGVEALLETAAPPLEPVFTDF